MKNVEVLENAERIALIDLSGLSGVKLSYAIAQNAKALGEEALAIQGKLEYPKEYLELKEKYRKHFKAHALKDESGEYVIEEGKYLLDPEKEDDYKKLIESENPENQPILEKVQKIEEEYNTFLENNSNVTIQTVKLDELPDTINPTQMTALSFMIDEFVG
tara:strand:+ start:328 stop:810 length:483 start_codon:yes stop_codon:yes gene_type:complete